uniref:Immunoglobulin V-set domain-containing protein n=1 Tax=Hucho hucho TaxID=62062 RepID=A0A4W5LPF8_9TELE
FSIGLSIVVLFTIVFFFSGVHCGVELTQKGPISIEPGKSLTLSSSGLDINGYWMAWIRQAPGKRLEWRQTLSCKVSGFSLTSTCYCTVWVR